MRRLLLFGIPILAIGIIAARAIRESGAEYATTLYRMAPSDPDKWTPGQRQFDPGFLVLTTPALDVITKAEDALTTFSGQDATGKLLSQILTTHSEGDWGDLPESAAAVQDAMMAQSDVNFLEVRGIHLIAGTELEIETVEHPAGNLTTIYLPGER